jgi:hypothetical protein
MEARTFCPRFSFSAGTGADEGSLSDRDLLVFPASSGSRAFQNPLCTKGLLSSHSFGILTVEQIPLIEPANPDPDEHNTDSIYRLRFSGQLDLARPLGSERGPNGGASAGKGKRAARE